MQASANVLLTKAVGTPYGGAALQLSVAWGLLLVLAAVTGALPAIAQVSEVPTWYLLGGLASPLYITSGILLFARLGALASVGLFVAGQVVASLTLDLFGLLEVPRRPLSLGIGASAIAVLVGIALVIRGSSSTLGSGVRLRSVTQRGWPLLGLGAGAGLPVQGAVNALLRAELKEPAAVALISFTVAMLASGALLLVLLAVRATGAPRLRPTTQMPWWGWLGGACAAAYVTATFLLIPVIGATTTVALTVTGMQLAAAAIDDRGLLRMPKRRLTGTRTVGLGLLVAGSLLVPLALR